MANSNEEQKKITKENKEQLASPHESSFIKNNYLSFLLFIVAFFMLITVYNLYCNHKLQKKLMTENNILIKNLEQIKQLQTENKQQIIDKGTHLQQIENDLQNKIDTVNKQLRNAMNQNMYQNQDWLLLKARYYLELAQINTHWNTTYDAAIELLQQADILLSQVSAPKIFDIRQIIAKEITQLKAITPIDIPGLLSQLDAAQLSVSKLTIQSPNDDNNLALNNEETQKTASSWRNHFKNSINMLKKLVVIRRNNDDAQPLIAPLMESVLRESVQLNIKEAQWAILNNQPVVYQIALKQAITTLKKAFNEGASNTAALIKQLTKLQQTKITVEKPEVGFGLPMLNQLINNKELEPSTTNEKKED